MSQSKFRSRPTIGVSAAPSSAEEIDLFTYDAQSVLGRDALAMRLIRVAQSIKEWEVESTASYIATVSCLIFPELIGSLTQASGLNITVHKVDCRAEDFAAGCWKDDEEASPSDPLHHSHRSKLPRDTGLFGSLTPDDSVEDTTPEVSGGRWGIEMYPIGKNVSHANMAGYTQNRPNAIIRKYALSDRQRRLFEGSYSPTFETLTAVKTCFTIFPTLRYTLGLAWISWLSTSAGRHQNAFRVTFDLTNGAGFGSAALILDLLTAYPELQDYPRLKAQVREFYDAFEEFKSKPEATRGFLKVLHGDQVSLFRAVNRGELLAMAIFHARVTSPTVDKFMDTSAYASFGTSVNDYLIKLRKEPIPGIGTSGATVPTAVGQSA